jgi:hypothetical protein
MAPKIHPTFEVDKEGLAKIMGRRGPDFALLELLQNSWDEASTTVRVGLEYQGRGRCLLTVEDDNPTGFADLSHAYRLFADSAKKGQATKRGRFNLGEKLVIAICDTASVATTTGTIRFDAKGRTHHPTERREAGSIFTGLLRMTKPQYEVACREIRKVLVPDGIATYFNGVEIPHREPLRTFTETLQTEIADEDGQLKRSMRAGQVRVYEVLEGEKATIYEMGIPVVATGDRWHVSVEQKVPLNVDRDNVTPAYLRDLRRAVLNHCHDLLTADASAEKWTDDALADEKVTPEAVNALLDLRFGEKRVSYDPSDREANGIAASEGYTVIAARTLSKDAWVNVRAAGALTPAGQVTPSPKPYDPGKAETRKVIPEDQWTPGMQNFARFSRNLAEPLVGVSDLSVVFVNDQECRNFSATWGRGGMFGGGSQLEWNVQVLGRAYFDQSPQQTAPLALLIHEMGHEHGGGDHLSRVYLNELCRIGADLARLVMLEPAAFADNPPRKVVA